MVLVHQSDSRRHVRKLRLSLVVLAKYCCQYLAAILLIRVLLQWVSHSVPNIFFQNGIFTGPALSVPLMLLAVYGLGYGSDNTPIYMKFFMSLSFLRYGLEGLVTAIYGGNRPNLVCPGEDIYCHYRNPKTIISLAGMENASLWVCTFSSLSNVRYMTLTALYWVNCITANEDKSDICYTILCEFG